MKTRMTTTAALLGALPLAPGRRRKRKSFALTVSEAQRFCKHPAAGDGA
jgi:hypothetical protein